MQDEHTQDPMAPVDPAARARPAPGAAGAVEAVAEPRREDAVDDGFLTSPAAPAEDGVLAPAGLPDGDDYGEFSWPEGFQVNPAALGRFVPLARELGLDKAGAQRLAGLYAELDQERHREQAAFIAGQNKEWRDEIRSHPEYGGANLERTTGDVARTMRRFGSPPADGADPPDERPELAGNVLFPRPGVPGGVRGLLARRRPGRRRRRLHRPPPVPRPPLKRFGKNRCLLRSRLS
ncbi:MAG: hypothetical protein LUG50_03700 [Planctomycetaceae bacterium]|nr:hypothetical protein [Planctomycetaceae bacterium]